MGIYWCPLSCCSQCLESMSTLCWPISLRNCQMPIVERILLKHHPAFDAHFVTHLFSPPALRILISFIGFSFQQFFHQALQDMINAYWLIFAIRFYTTDTTTKGTARNMMASSVLQTLVPLSPVPGTCHCQQNNSSIQSGIDHCLHRDLT